MSGPRRTKPDYFHRTTGGDYVALLYYGWPEAFVNFMQKGRFAVKSNLRHNVPQETDAPPYDDNKNYSIKRSGKLMFLSFWEFLEEKDRAAMQTEVHEDFRELTHRSLGRWAAPELVKSAS